MKFWQILGWVYVFVYGVFTFGAVRDALDEKRQAMALVTGALSLVAAVGMTLLFLGIHSGWTIAFWQVLVVPLILGDLAMVIMDARKSFVERVDEPHIICVGIVITLLMELPCLWFNLKYAFFLVRERAIL